jgi:hypothetical protein
MDVVLLRADHLELGLALAAPELPHRRDQQRDRAGVHRAEPYHAADLVLLVGRPPQPVHRVEHAGDVRQELAALVADLRARAATLQQRDTQLPLQVADGLAQRGLGQVQRLGGPPQRSEPGHRLDVLELLDPHCASPDVAVLTVFKGMPISTSTNPNTRTPG